MEYVFAIAGFASLIGTLYEIVRNERGRAVGAFLFTVVALTIAGIEWQKNRELQDSRKAAASVIESLPVVSDFDVAEDGDLQGIVLATIGFLEARREQFPETLDSASDTYDELRAEQARDTAQNCSETEIFCPDEVDQRNRARLERAAGTMIALLKSIAGDEYDSPYSDG